ncbi:MAG TPA: ABC transporter ATP-binding protein [Saprospiraceae bacterium]|nr:ABC transporter ATP-binding protein [Saprospiraceae bacterium]
MKDKALTGRLRMTDVSHYYGSMQVIEHLDLVVQPGEVVMLVGPSGCGKSTILNLISGHIQPSAGSIHREGIIRTVYQSSGLFPWLTVSENIKMGLRSLPDHHQIEMELKELIELVHLDGFDHHYPHQLSGGMRQRVELARVLAGDSDILLMDEPFSALDYQARLRMRSELVRILKQQPRTVVFVTHDIEEAAQLADRVLVLSPRPATILLELRIDTARPRGLTDQSVIEAMNEILTALGLHTGTELTS